MKFSNRYPSAEIVARIRRRYPKGCRVELAYMDKDPYSRLSPGDRGTVSSVDDTGTIFVDWDCGSRLGMVHGVDYIQKITRERAHLTMNNHMLPDEETLAKIKRMYPKGCRVKLIHLSDDVLEILMRGEQGTVNFVNDTGTVFVDWDCGDSFGIVYGADRIWKV